jgi:hypothetical protein
LAGHNTPKNHHKPLGKFEGVTLLSALYLIVGKLKYYLPLMTGFQETLLVCYKKCAQNFIGFRHAMRWWMNKDFPTCLSSPLPV